MKHSEPPKDDPKAPARDAAVAESVAEAAQERYEAALTSHQTERVGDMNLSLNGLPSPDDIKLTTVEDDRRGEQGPAGGEPGARAKTG